VVLTNDEWHRLRYYNFTKLVWILWSNLIQCWYNDHLASILMPRYLTSKECAIDCRLIVNVRDGTTTGQWSRWYLDFHELRSCLQVRWPIYCIFVSESSIRDYHGEDVITTTRSLAYIYLWVTNVNSWGNVQWNKRKRIGLAGMNLVGCLSL
jgi:hypothetical protein